MKLAEYKDGKFLMFLKCGHGVDMFSYGDETICVVSSQQEGPYIQETLLRDEVDPLSRFDGRFNGRTYGEGRFVLISGDEDDLNLELKFDKKNLRGLDPHYEGHHLLVWGFTHFKHFCENKDTSKSSSIREQNEFTKELFDALKAAFPSEKVQDGWKKHTSIHQNPGLFNMIKSRIALRASD